MLPVRLFHLIPLNCSPQVPMKRQIGLNRRLSLTSGDCETSKMTKTSFITHLGGIADGRYLFWF